MRTRAGKKYGPLSWLRSGTSRHIIGDLSTIANTKLTPRPASPSPPRPGPVPASVLDAGDVAAKGDDGSASSLALRAVVTLVPSVSFRPDGTFTTCLGRAVWTLERETPRARVYAGKNWSVRPWDDDVPGRRGFVARFRWGSEHHVVHVNDDAATVAFLVECLGEVVSLSVTGIASRACGLLVGSTTLRELAARERRAYTIDDVGDIVVFTKR
ncbi:MAG: hypothetical protein CMI16_03230 [Opitutaceae bacterium]|nr:hypothetical protein [Opitutaceae bacterium]